MMKKLLRTVGLLAIMLLGEGAMIPVKAEIGNIPSASVSNQNLSAPLLLSVTVGGEAWPTPSFDQQGNAIITTGGFEEYNSQGDYQRGTNSSFDGSKQSVISYTANLPTNSDSGYKYAYYDLAPDENGQPQEYGLQKMQYQWQVNADTNLVITWAEIFHPGWDSSDGPDPSGTPVVKVFSWTNSTGSTNSPPYTIDPLNYTNADGSMQTNTGWYEVVHLPVQLKDLKGAGDADDVTVAFRSSATDNSEANIAWIEPIKSQADKTPRMPQLQISLPGAPSGLKVKWRMENRYPRRNGRDDIDFPNSDQNPYKVLPANQPWNIYSEYANPEKFFGGDCTIFMTILDGNENPISSEQQLKFRIRGKNPEDTDCKASIVAQGAVWYAWAIAKHESADSVGFYNQFANGLANGGAGAHGAKGEPFYSPDEGDGWGLFQRDSSSGHPVTSEETWSWDGNMRGFLNKEYPEHLQAANKYVDKIKSQNPSTFEEPMFNIKRVNISGRDVAALTSYNRGGLPSEYIHFDGSKPTGEKWTKTLPNAPEKDQPYVYEIMDQYNGG